MQDTNWENPSANLLLRAFSKKIQLKVNPGLHISSKCVYHYIPKKIAMVGLTFRKRATIFSDTRKGPRMHYCVHTGFHDKNIQDVLSKFLNFCALPITKCPQKRPLTKLMRAFCPCLISSSYHSHIK